MNVAEAKQKILLILKERGEATTAELAEALDVTYEATRQQIKQLETAGLVALQAVCAWCLVSLAIMVAIFVLVHARRPDAAPGGSWPTWWLGNGLIALGLLAMLQLSATGLLERREDPRLRALAQHLAQSDAKFYGASWCPACNEQKRVFGAAARHLPYVECSPDGRNGGDTIDKRGVECDTDDVHPQRDPHGCFGIARRTQADRDDSKKQPRHGGQRDNRQIRNPHRNDIRFSSHSLQKLRRKNPTRHSHD